MSHVFGNKSPFLPLCFSIPSQFHLCAPRFSLLIKSNNPKRGKKQREGKVFIRVPSALGQPPAEDGCSQCSKVHWPTDWLTDWRVCLFTRKNNSALSSGPTASPPSCAQHPDQFLFQLGNPLGVSDTLSLTLSTLAGNNFGRIIPPPRCLLLDSDLYFLFIF